MNQKWRDNVLRSIRGYRGLWFSCVYIMVKDTETCSFKLGKQSFVQKDLKT